MNFCFYTYLIFTFQINNERNYIFLFWKALEPYCHTFLEFLGRDTQDYTPLGRSTPGLAVNPIREYLGRLP